MNSSYLTYLICDTYSAVTNCFKQNLEDISLATEHVSIIFGPVHEFNKKNQLHRPGKQMLFVSLGK